MLLYRSDRGELVTTVLIERLMSLIEYPQQRSRYEGGHSLTSVLYPEHVVSHKSSSIAVS